MENEDEERVFNNPTYDATSTTELLTPASSEYAIPERGQDTFPAVTYTMYDAVGLPSQRRGKTAQNNQTYNVLDRGSANGKQM